MTGPARGGAGPVTEPLAELVRFADALRGAGLTAGIDRVVIAAEALAIMGGDEPYWPLRVAFCTRAADLGVFDRVYHGWFGAVVPGDAELDAEHGGGAGRGVGADGDSGAGNSAGLATRDVEALTEVELSQVKTWIDALAPAPRRRPAMRCEPARTGLVDVRRTVRQMLRDHGEVSAPRYRRRVHRPRRLLLLVDVSGSMGRYGDLLLRFAHAAVAAGPRTTEVFGLGTRWTRLTEQLRARRPDDAMRAMAAVESDWHQGTTLGVALRDLLHHWGGRTSVRSAVVVLGSDGFEFADQSLLREQVARLARLADTLIWVDPLRRSETYTPADGDLAEAQSYAAVRLPGHNFEALRRLAKEIRR